LIVSFLKFLWHSRNEHGVHSPFVFDFVTKGLYGKKLIKDFYKIKNLRIDFLKNNKKIYIEDFGAGSKIFKTNERTICQIAKHVSLSPKKAKILSQIIHYFKPDNILELGTSIGLGTITLAYSNPEAKILTVEGCKTIFFEAKTLFEKEKMQQIEIRHASFGDFIKTNDKIFDFILFDGNHTFEATIKYFSQLLNKKHNNSLWVFDDIHWSKDMEKAWNYIKNHQEVSVSIDLFYYGLVFFRNEQEKEHFVIRP